MLKLFKLYLNSWLVVTIENLEAKQLYWAPVSPLRMHKTYSACGNNI